MSEIPAAELRRKVMGCWLGKAVGGTLGQTFEGLEGPLDADFYVPVPTEMVPNDDLDLQVLYACIMDAMPAPRVDAQVLAAAWEDHVAFPWCEYGVGQRNYAEGIRPPFTGSFDNWFTCGEGAAIRSELWACLAAGDPDLAASYALSDACFDHAGDGVYAPQFLARLQALAFVESDRDKLLDGALAGIPANSTIYRVVQDTRAWFAESGNWLDVQRRIMAAYGNSDFTDVRPNTGFVVLGWLAGRDFAERICITNNCGQDCDSTTASIGALLGILDPDSIPERWLAPIGRDLVLSKEITGVSPPPTLDGFTDLVLDLRNRIGGAPAAPIDSQFNPDDWTIPVDMAWYSTARGTWDVRDVSELPPPDADVPDGLAWQPATVPGTWVRRAREDFDDRILLLRYQADCAGYRAVRLLLNCNVDCRVWWDGRPIHAAQGSRLMWPVTHTPPVGQFVDFDVDTDRHELVIALKRPPADEPVAEWILGLTQRPSFQWIPNAFRPQAGPISTN